MFFSHETQRSGGLAAVGAVVLRLGAALLLLQQHVWAQAPQAFQALWNAKSWDVIDAVSRAGFPASKFLSLFAAMTVTLVTACWLLGFVTRFSALVFLPVTLGALWVCNGNDDSAGAETAILYFLVSVAIILAGPGWLSLDALFRHRRESASKPHYKF